ncbi:hypothetical protein Gohar_022190, partial [Gossypium harknessii]|nr:hypothetical protein [Gossypium harknessii]
MQVRLLPEGWHTIWRWSKLFKASTQLNYLQPWLEGFVSYYKLWSNGRSSIFP